MIDHDAAARAAFGDTVACGAVAAGPDSAHGHSFSAFRHKKQRIGDDRGAAASTG
ncbi:MAG: hypothetical protein AAF360_06625 [Pseudomonadota bacterium]